MNNSLVDVRSSVLLGAATGMRSQMGMAAVLVGVDRERLPPHFRRPAAVRSAVVALVGELVADKTEKIIDRMRAGPLAARFVLGASAAGLLAHSRGRPVLPSAAIAGVSALAGAKLGHDVRAMVGRQIPDRFVAVAEDLVAFTCAAVAVRSTDSAQV